MFRNSPSLQLLVYVTYKEVLNTRCEAAVRKVMMKTRGYVTRLTSARPHTPLHTLLGVCYYVSVNVNVHDRRFVSAGLLFWTMCVCLWGFVLANCPRVEVQPVLITVNRVHRVLASACVCGFNERWNLLTEAFSFNKKKKKKKVN